ncbi:MAG: hypothetical protein ACOC5A_02935 [Halanaerobiales bacterium]
MDLLSRAGAVVRLIEIRKIMYEREEKTSEPPGDYIRRIKRELDDFLVELIGVPEEGRHELNGVLQKAIRGEIQPETAAVAAHEIFSEYHNEKVSGVASEKDSNQDEICENEKKKKKLNELYETGYR